MVTPAQPSGGEEAAILAELRSLADQMLACDADADKFDELGARAQEKLARLGLAFRRAVAGVTATAARTSEARGKLHSESEALGTGRYILGHYGQRVSQTLAHESKYTSAELDVEEGDLSGVTRVDGRCKEYKARLAEEKRQRQDLVSEFRQRTSAKEDEQRKCDEASDLERKFGEEVALQRAGLARIQDLYQSSKYREGVTKTTLDEFLPLPLQILLAQAAARERGCGWHASTEGTASALEEFATLAEEAGCDPFATSQLVLMHPLSVKVKVCGAENLSLSFHYLPDLNLVLVSCPDAVLGALRAATPEDRGVKLEQRLRERCPESSDKKKWRLPTYAPRSAVERLRDFGWAQGVCGLGVGASESKAKRRRKEDGLEEARRSARAALEGTGGGLAAVMEGLVGAQAAAEAKTKA